MAFKFNWSDFNQEFYTEAKKLLTIALNKGSKPANIVDRIIVKELDLGTQAPHLEILEIGELTEDKFRGIFKLIYNGDAHLVLQTKIQANPVSTNRSTPLFATGRWGMLAADKPLVVPMLLKLSKLRLRGIVVLVVSKKNGVTLVFKNDPFEEVEVGSTFDNLPNIQSFLQADIEERLREMLLEQLPEMIHELSKRWLEEKNESERENDHQSNLKIERSKKSSILLNELDTEYETRSLPDLYVNRSHNGRSYPVPRSSTNAWDNLSTRSYPLEYVSTKWYGNSNQSDVWNSIYETGLPQHIPTYTQLSGLHRRSGLKQLSSESLSRSRICHSQSMLSMPSTLSRAKSYSSTSSLTTYSDYKRKHKHRSIASSIRKHRVNNEIPKASSVPIIEYSTEQDYFSMRNYLTFPQENDEPSQKAVLFKPSTNTTAARLTSLLNSNQTISLYTRPLEHYASRTSPNLSKSLTEFTFRKGGLYPSGNTKLNKRSVLKFPGLGLTSK